MTPEEGRAELYPWTEDTHDLCFLYKIIAVAYGSDETWQKDDKNEKGFTDVLFN